METAQLELIYSATAERPPVGIRIESGGYEAGRARSRLLACGPELDAYLKKVKTLKSPTFKADYVTAPADCRAATQWRDRPFTRAEVEDVVARLRKKGVPAAFEDPGPPQTEGPIRWGAPDEWGTIRSEEVLASARPGIYQVYSSGDAWHATYLHGAQDPVLLTVGPGEGGAKDQVIFGTESLDAMKDLLERDFELASPTTGWAYEDWVRGADTKVVLRGVLEWRGKGRKMGPLPYRIMSDVMTFPTKEAAQKHAKKRHEGLVGPTVPVRAKPVRVYVWDAKRDGPMALPYFPEGRAHGAWALSPGPKQLLTRWAKNQ